MWTVCARECVCYDVVGSWDVSCSESDIVGLEGCEKLSVYCHESRGFGRVFVDDVEDCGVVDHEAEVTVVKEMVPMQDVQMDCFHFQKGDVAMCVLAFPMATDLVCCVVGKVLVSAPSGGAGVGASGDGGGGNVKTSLMVYLRKVAKSAKVGESAWRDRRVAEPCGTKWGSGKDFEIVECVTAPEHDEWASERETDGDADDFGEESTRNGVGMTMDDGLCRATKMFQFVRWYPKCV